MMKTMLDMRSLTSAELFKLAREKQAEEKASLEEVNYIKNETEKTNARIEKLVPAKVRAKLIKDFKVLRRVEQRVQTLKIIVSFPITLEYWIEFYETLEVSVDCSDGAADNLIIKHGKEAAVKSDFYKKAVAAHKTYFDGIASCAKNYKISKKSINWYVQEHV